MKKRLKPVAQLLQVYASLSELELAAGGSPGSWSRASTRGAGYGREARAWAAREAEKEKFMETIGAFNNDPLGTLAAMEKSG